jgi:LysR family transcriptional regulator of abg operon
MKSSQLRDFLAVARTGSIRAAARTLSLTQPTLTKNLRLLEADLGVPLLTRSGRGVELTEAGRRFHARAEIAWNELDRARSEMRQLVDASATTSLAIGVSAAPALIGLSSSMRDFRREFPAVHVRIVPGNFSAVHAGLRAGTLDFSIGPRSDNYLGDEFAVETLMHNTRKVVCRIGHPLQQARSLTELLAADWIATGGSGAGQIDFERYFRQHLLEAPVAAVSCEYPTALFALLSSTDMLALLPAQWTSTPISAGLLCEIPVRETIRDADICAVYRGGVPLTPAANRFLTLMRRSCASSG